MDNTQSTEECKKDIVNLPNDSIIKKVYDFGYINYTIIGVFLTAVYSVLKLLYIDNAEKFYNIPAKFFITEINLEYIIPFAALGISFILCFIITLEKEKYVPKIVYITQKIVMMFWICFLSYKYMPEFIKQISIKNIPLIIVVPLIITVLLTLAVPMIIVVLFNIFKKLTDKSLKNYIEMNTCPEDSISVWNLDIENIKSEKIISKFNKNLLKFTDEQKQADSILNKLKIDSKTSNYNDFIKQQCKDINDIYKNKIGRFIEILKQDKLISKENFNEMHYEIFKQNKTINETISNKKNGESEYSCNESKDRKIIDQIDSYQKVMIKKYYDIIHNNILIHSETKVLVWKYNLIVFMVAFVLILMLLYNASLVKNKTKYEIINIECINSGSKGPKYEVVILHKGSQIITQYGEIKGKNLTIYTNNYTIKESNNYEYTLQKFTKVVSNSNIQNSEKSKKVEIKCAYCNKE